tara:strand:- start:130 stop:552 length:423 start_codon:yes stop_codon:yes gene_type:complete
MPRGKPTSIVEQRITFGTFERQWLVEQEDYLKSQITQAKTAAFVVPIALGVTTVGATCALGYGIYAGMCAMADMLPANPLKNTIEAAKDIVGGNEHFGSKDQYNNPLGESGFSLHFNRLADPDWWLSFGDYSSYVDKKDR